MKTTLEIDIDDFLSEEEKKQYAIEAFKESVKMGMFKGASGVVLDSEIQRVIGNISYNIVMEAVQEYIPNCKDLIEKKTLDVIQKDSFRHEVFKEKDAWGGTESLAVTYMREVVRDNKEFFRNKIKAEIENYDTSSEIKEAISNEFSEMADNLYKLSDLFIKK